METESKMDIASFSHRDHCNILCPCWSPCLQFHSVPPSSPLPIDHTVAFQSHCSKFKPAPFKSYQWLSSTFRMKCTFLSMASKARQGLASAYPSNLIPCHSLSLYAPNYLQFPKASSNFMPSSLCTCHASIWNALSPSPRAPLCYSSRFSSSPSFSANPHPPPCPNYS